jgi:glutamyl-tRNA reductase
MTVRSALRTHAAAVSELELERAGRRLQALTPDQRAVVDELARQVAARVTDCLLEQARTDDRLEQALAGSYGTFPVGLH